MIKKGSKITALNAEIKVQRFIIGQLIKIVTENKITLPENLLKNIRILYGGAIEQSKGPVPKKSCDETTGVEKL